MADTRECPFCGAPLAENANHCDACGNAVHLPNPNLNSAAEEPTKYHNSAEMMDDVKNHLRSGDEQGAEQVVGSSLGLNQDAARTVVQQANFDLQNFSQAKPAAAEKNPDPFSKPEVIDAPNAPMPEKPKSKKWILWGSIGAVLFLCLCCCLPLIYLGYNFFKK